MKAPYFDKTISTKRLTDITGTDNQDWQTNLASVNCNIQPLDDGFSEDLEGSYGRDYLMFCDLVDILEGDKIVEDDVEYLVKGIRRFEVMNFSVLELRIRLTK
jgi:hypothetical protein